MTHLAPVRVLIADDHHIVRVGLSAVLGYDPHILVVGAAEDGEQAVAQACELRPDIVFMDVRMPRLDGIAATSRIVHQVPSVRVLMLSTTAESGIVQAARTAGASGFVLKTAQLPELREAITVVLGGGEWLSTELRNSGVVGSASQTFSARQREVLDLLAAGLSNKEIARSLGFTANGTKAHLKVIFQKLGVVDRTEAVVEAIRRGLVRVT